MDDSLNKYVAALLLTDPYVVVCWLYFMLLQCYINATSCFSCIAGPILQILPLALQMGGDMSCTTAFFLNEALLVYSSARFLNKFFIRNRIMTWNLYCATTFSMGYRMCLCCYGNCLCFLLFPMHMLPASSSFPGKSLSEKCICRNKFFYHQCFTC